MLTPGTPMRPIEIMLVDDSPGDVRLALEALKESKLQHHIQIAEDGVEAMAILRRQGPYGAAPRPDLILLDLNLPKKDGREVLAEIKSDEDLKTIVVVILTTSQAEADVLKSYQLQANSYVTKPLDLDQFVTVVQAIEHFWFSVATLPRRA